MNPDFLDKILRSKFKIHKPIWVRYNRVSTSKKLNKCVSRNVSAHLQIRCHFVVYFRITQFKSASSSFSCDAFSIKPSALDISPVTMLIRFLSCSASFLRLSYAFLIRSFSSQSFSFSTSRRFDSLR